MLHKFTVVFIVLSFVQCKSKNTGEFFTETGRREVSSGDGSGGDSEKTDFSTWLKSQNNDDDDGSGNYGSGTDLDTSSGLPEPKCDRKLDIGFILDGSESIGPIGFRKIKAYAKEILNKFELSNCDNVGIIRFSDYAHSETYLKVPRTKAEIFHRIDAIEGPSAFQPLEVNRSRIPLALLVAEELFFTSQLGSRHHSKKLLVVMTDGKQPEIGISNRTLTTENLVKKLIKKGVRILVLAIGDDPDVGELLKLSSHEKDVFPERRLEDLKNILVPTSENLDSNSQNSIDDDFFVNIDVESNDNDYTFNFI
ncbi:von Willebrand factor-like [Xenia sp. Carnegie-2017]|uniref:von Willebrand factor-like n=1 Tax=Xenia sp. Carnegie-2017 TaxID=2897299 RepID=UPI001F033FE6|nr:von Willebrand factor-like [Xenia sp. Carnegie-2017]XP_046849692.1 von Willebrand factor-like [Xenia sp. Carnegie-2017]XP_046849693.1 von Willebrand factor-like [Xenia sp. Carnegie-2017]XP_046849694.1 von Willebrand factor-like [Xenia sp. Carnegie-2017]